jgi:PEP-CTERM motif
VKNNTSKLASIWIALAVTAGFVTSVLGGLSPGIVASATLSGVAGANNTFDYTLTLSNAPNATTSIEGFWYSWIPGQFFLPTTPSSASGAASGWTPTIFGPSIQFQGDAGHAIVPGSSKSFTFVSTDTPAALAGTSGGFPIGDSVVYPGTIDFSDSPPNEQITVQSIQSVPEPSSLALLIAGALGLLAARWPKRHAQ